MTEVLDCKKLISIHSLRMEGDRQPVLHGIGRSRYFNPLPPHGGRRCCQRQFFHIIYFNPLPPHGGRLVKHYFYNFFKIFQSTPSAWRETFWTVRPCCISSISIHSLRMEGDGDADAYCTFISNFNPLPPHGGRRKIKSVNGSPGIFQSTPSAWRETMQSDIHDTAAIFQSTPSAWRETTISIRI